MSMQNEIEAKLKNVWEAEIRLFEQIQCLEFLPNAEAPENANERESLSDILVEIERLRHVSQTLQHSWNQLGLSFETDLALLRTKKRDSLKRSINYVRHAQQSVNTEKREVLEQLAAVNLAQTGNDRYRKRKR